MNLWTRLTGLVLGRRLDRELDGELREHLERLIAQHLAAGMPREEAELAARRRFGDVVRLRERDRESRGWLWIEETARDLRFAARSLVRSPGYSIATAATLAVGVGITTGIIRFTEPFLFPEIPVPAVERTVVIGDGPISAVNDEPPYPFFSFTSRFAFLRDSSTSLASIGGIRSGSLNLVLDGDPAAVHVGWTTAGYFDLVGARPEIGRLFLPEEYHAAADAGPVVVSWECWQKRFGGQEQAIGRIITLDGTSRTVVGVLPRAFRPPYWFFAADVYLPTRPDVTDPFPPFTYMQVIGRLKPRVTLEQAGLELNTLVLQAPPVVDASQHDAVKLRLLPIRDYYRAGRILWLFAGGVAFLYAIACTNAVNLMLARTIHRRRELGVRVALGGGRWRIVRLLLGESLLLSVVAGLGAYALAQASIRLLIRLQDGTIDGPLLHWPMLLLVMGVSVLTGLIVVAAPAVRLGSMRINDVLKDGAGSLGDSRRLSRLRDGLAVLQAALAVVLLVGAGLTLQNFRRLAHASLGFDPQHKVVVTGLLPQDLDEVTYLGLADRFREAMEGLPGVRRVVCASSVPFSGASGSFTVKVDDHPELGDVQFSHNRVTADYFEALGVPLLAGRGFGDARAGDPPVVVINELAAKRLFPGGSALGRTLDGGPFGRCEIVGIARDVQHSGPRDERRPQLYIPLHQRPFNSSALCGMLQLDGPAPEGFEALVRRAAYAADPRLVVMVDSMAHSMRLVLSEDRRNAVVFNVLSALALSLASTGLFSLMAYAVAQRQREFGVRAALGATRGDLLRTAMRQGLLLAVTGVAIGLGAAAALGRFLQATLYEVSAHDPLTFLAVAILLLATATAACWLPARRAARADPLELLRRE